MGTFFASHLPINISLHLTVSLRKFLQLDFIRILSPRLFIVMHSFSSSTSRLIGRSTSCKNVYHVYTSSVHAQAFRIQLLLPFRTYATHRDAATASTTPLLSQALDQRQRSARRQDSVGPFQLGLIPPTPQDVGEIKKWSQLNTTEKGMSYCLFRVSYNY